MKKTLITLVLAAAMVAMTAPVHANDDAPNENEPNEEQTGRTIDCSHADGLHRLITPISNEGERAFNGAYGTVASTQTVTVDPGTEFNVSAEDGSDVFVAFFDENDNWVGSLAGPNGTVPNGEDGHGVASWASVCAWNADASVFSTAPNPETVFHYQDGFVFKPQSA